MPHRLLNQITNLQRFSRIGLSLKNFSHLLPHISVAVVIFIYTLIQIQHFTPAYQEVDPDGYLFLAKRIARLQYPAVRDDDPFMHQSHVWVETPDGRVIPKFSPGYPFLLAIFYRLGGDEAMFLVSPVMGGLALIGAYLLFLLWMSPLAAALATWALAINPMYPIYSGYLLSHASNTCAIIYGMYFLWKWVRGHTGRSGIWAGLLLGFAVTIRYTSALMGSVVLIAVVSRWLQNHKRREERLNASFLKNPVVQQTSILLCCYAVFPLILGIYNWRLFGNPFVTGYSLTHEQNAFSLGYFQRNLHLMINGLNTTALFLIFPLGLAGMLLVGALRERLMRIFWFLPIVILYTSYYWAFSGMPYLRFTICTFPVVIGSAFLLMDSALAKARTKSATLSLWTHQVAMIAFVALLVLLRYGEIQRGMRRTVSDTGSRAVANAARMLSKTLQPDAVIFSQSPFFCYIGTREKFRLYDLQRFKAPFNSPERRQPKRTERLRKLYSSLNEAGKLRKKREIVRAFITQKRQVIFFIPQDALKREQQQLSNAFKFTLLKEWNVSLGASPVKWGVYQLTVSKKKKLSRGAG